MKSCWIARAITVLSVCSILVGCLGCGGGSGTADAGKLQELLANALNAANENTRLNSLQDIVSQSLSLGMLDGSGGQLNKNVVADAASLTQKDLAILSYLASEGYSHTVQEVVEYLADFGVTLASTQQVISIEDFLPDLQKYVNWSFDHNKENQAILGLLIAAGKGTDIPDSAPNLSAESNLNPTTTLMVLADILVGINNDVKRPSANWFTEAAYAEEDSAEVAKEIEGLITIVEPFLDKLGKKIPEVAKQIIAAFAAGDHFNIRILNIPLTEISGDMSKFPVAKSIELTKQSPNMNFAIAVVLVPSGIIVKDIPIQYTATLFSPGNLGLSLPLYPDADAQLHISPGLEKYAIDYRGESGGHRIDWTSLSNQCVMNVKMTNMTAVEDRIAGLHASGIIPASELIGALLSEHGETVESLGIDMTTLLPLIEAVKGVKVHPWMCMITLKAPPINLNINPETTTGTPGKSFSFSVLSDLPVSTLWYSWYVTRRDDPSVDKSQGKYYWDERNLGNNQLDLMCEVEGIYDIKCDVTRKDDGLEIGTVYSTATINKQLVEHKAFTVGIEGQFIAEAGGRISIEAKPSIPMSELPAVTWEWDWGDDSQIEIKSGSTGNQVYHGYAKNGKYQVRLAVKDMATKQILCECSQDVIIDDTILFSKVGSLSGTVWLPTKLEHGNIMNRIYTFANTEISLLPWSIDRFWNGSSTGTTSEFHCAGLQFTGETYSTGTSVAAGTQTTKNTVTGTISRDPLKIATLEYTVTHKAPDYNGTGKYWEYTKTIVIQNVPIDKRRGGDKPWFNIKLTGTDIQKYVTSASYESYLMEKDGTIAYQKFVQFDWNNSSSSGGATLEISFGEQY